MKAGGLPLWSMHVTAGNPTQAIVLAQLVYWWGPTKDLKKYRARKLVRGQRCIAKSRSELAGETGLTPRKVQHAINILVERGFLNRLHGSWGGRTTCHFVVNTRTIRRHFLSLESELTEFCRGIC